MSKPTPKSVAVKPAKAFASKSTAKASPGKSGPGSNAKAALAKKLAGAKSTAKAGVAKDAAKMATKPTALTKNTAAKASNTKVATTVKAGSTSKTGASKLVTVKGAAPKTSAFKGPASKALAVKVATSNALATKPDSKTVKPASEAKGAPVVKSAVPTKAAVPVKSAAAAKPVVTPKGDKAAQPAAAAKPVTAVGAKAAAKNKNASDSTDTTPAASTAEESGKSARKGITVVTPKPARKAVPKPPTPSLVPIGLGRLMDPANPPRRPLIPSGPKAASGRPLGAQGAAEPPPPLAKGKTPFNKKELDRYRALLLAKRAELVGDVRTMEKQALNADSGSSSTTPQHMAEQGSETYEQSLSLDLAAADRKLIREIDEALNRIDEGTYGICEILGKPIKPERLEELPWARYSIEAQRERERFKTR